jgi:hypothetical protein
VATWELPQLQPPADLGVDGTWSVETVDYAAGSPATGALLRVRGPNGSAFVKVLNHLRHWAMYPFLPPDFAARFAAEFPWRAELVLWEPEFSDCLPAGWRTPELLGVVDLGDDRLAVWMEDVITSPEPWGPERYRRAAELLGRFTAARTAVPSDSPVGFALRKLALEGLPAQLAGTVPDGTLGLWWKRIPELLDRMDTMVQAVPHGDASPQNLLVPAGPDAAEFVVIDCSFQSPQAVGFDLGQLLVGLVQAGLEPSTDLTRRRDEVLESFLVGYRSVPGHPVVADEDVRGAFAATLLIRSGFTNQDRDLTQVVVDTAEAWCA